MTVKKSGTLESKLGRNVYSGKHGNLKARKGSKIKFSLSEVKILLSGCFKVLPFVPR